MLLSHFYFYKKIEKRIFANKRSPGSTPGTTRLSRISNSLRPSHFYKFKLRLKEIAYPLTLKDSVISFLLIYGYILSLKNGINFADLAPSLPEEVNVQPRKENNNISAIRKDISDIKKDIQNIKKELLETKKMNEEIFTIGAVCFISGIVIGMLIKLLISK